MGAFTAKPPAPSEALVAFREKIAEVADHLCGVYGYCAAVYNALWGESRLGLPGDNPGRLNSGNGRNFDVKLNFEWKNGDDTTSATSVTRRVAAFTQRGADLRALKDLGFEVPAIVPFVVPENPPADLTAAMETIRAIAQKAAKDGSLAISVIQSVLPALGLPPLPEKKAYFFRLAVEQPVVTEEYLVYKAVAFGEEEAFAEVQRKIANDEEWMRRNREEYDGADHYYRENYSERVTMKVTDLKYRPTAPGAAPVLDYERSGLPNPAETAAEEAPVPA